MSITPPGSLLSFNDTVSSTSATIAVSGIKYYFTSQPFKRMEFSHKRQREAPNSDGSMPIIALLVGNRPVQYFTGCNIAEEARTLTPDDSVYDDIYKRLDIKRYEMIGADSLDNEIDIVSLMSQAHMVLDAQFKAFLREAEADVSIDFLTTMQGVDLSYITTTGLGMSGAALGAVGTESNMLMVDFKPEVTYEIPLDDTGSSSEVLRTWSMVLESRTIVPDRSNTY